MRNIREDSNWPEVRVEKCNKLTRKHKQNLTNKMDQAKDRMSELKAKVEDLEQIKMWKKLICQKRAWDRHETPWETKPLKYSYR